MTKESFNSKQLKGYWQRGQIISQFAYIENLIKIFIIVNFFIDREKPLAKCLREEILDDQNFHFSALRSIFETILEKHHPQLYKQYGSHICGELRGMYDKRCTIAHSIEMANNIVDGHPTESSEPVVKWFKKGHPPDETVDSVFKKFFKLNDIVLPFIEKLVQTQENVNKLKGSTAG